MEAKGKYHFLRVARTAVALLCFATLSGGLVLGISTWAARVQIWPAVLAMSFGAVALWVVATLLFGRIYCSTVCPVGTICDGLARVVRLKKLHIKNPAYSYTPPRRRIRVTMLLLLVGALLVGTPVVLTAFDPFNIYNRALTFGLNMRAVGALATAGAVLILGVIVLPSIDRGRMVCNTLCPLGTILGCVSRFSLYHPDINTDLCTGCNHCVEVCKSQCINPQDHTVDLSRCVVCFDCTDVCPNNAITFRRGRHTLSTPMLQDTKQ